jgi:hypothetical protein
LCPGEFGVPDSFFRGLHLSGVLSHFFQSGGSRHGRRNHHYRRSSFLLLHRLEEETQVALIDQQSVLILRPVRYFLYFTARYTFLTFLSFADQFTLLCQKIFLAVPENTGGKTY